jgi:hypothetical protein
LQELLASLFVTEITFAAVRAIIATAVQQSLLTEPISRLLEVLLYGTSGVPMAGGGPFDCTPLRVLVASCDVAAWSYADTVANKEMSVSKVR